jgi:mRNA interferase MazF
MNGTNFYNQGEIIVMKIPYKDFQTGKIKTKKRPVMIISNEEYNFNNNSLIVCTITSNIRNWSHSLIIDSCSMENGFLPLKSELRIDMVNNIHKTEIIRPIGKLKSSIIKKALLNLKSII